MAYSNDAPFSATVGEINIICSDLQHSIRFYRHALGFKILDNVEFASEWQADAKRVFIRDPDGLVFEVIQEEPPT